ncbi:MAG: hypothetical protein E7179_04880 [Erysipelotrichaceae bacterium]|nr:hypothetical protein [Erysipelotrichaceae bacterium]
MRRYYLPWTIMVIGTIGLAYGAHLLFYHSSKGEGLYIPGLLLLIFGILFLIPSIAANIYYVVKRRKEFAASIDEKQKEIEAKEEKAEEPAPAIKPKEEKVEMVQHRREERPTYTPRREIEAPSRPTYSTSYVKKVGYGPVLRVCGPQIVDMRSNTYYRIEGNIVKEDGGGPRFEIRDNQIRDIYGSYLYEINGSNINKVYGGFYASISGSYITLYDLSEKYEMTDDLSKKQILAVAALLFGRY